MKASEAPEKIYIYPSDRAGEEYDDEWGTKPWGEDYVEYVRKDAFIDKATEWLKNKVENYIVDTPLCIYFDHKRAIEDFKNYMKGE